MDLVLDLAGLLVPAALGVLAGRAGLFGDVEAALGSLNKFALVVAFPALVFAALAGAPTGVGVSWRFVALTFGLLIAGPWIMGVAARRARPTDPSGAYEITVLFGNVAYLGLPWVERILPPEAFVVAVLGVSIHVTCAIVGGPMVLLVHGGKGERVRWRAILTRVARQPLVWAPLAGLAARALPDAPREAAVALLGPLGQAAAPVALFVLGLYVFEHRSVLRIRGLVDPFAWAPKLLLLPLAGWGGAVALGLVGAEHDVVIALCAMPTAITTFAFAQELGVGREVVARAIVWSSALSAVSLTALAVIFRV